MQMNYDLRREISFLSVDARGRRKGIPAGYTQFFLRK